MNLLELYKLGMNVDAFFAELRGESFSQVPDLVTLRDRFSTHIRAEVERLMGETSLELAHFHPTSTREARRAAVNLTGSISVLVQWHSNMLGGHRGDMGEDLSDLLMYNSDVADDLRRRIDRTAALEGVRILEVFKVALMQTKGDKLKRVAEKFSEVAIQLLAYESIPDSLDAPHQPGKTGKQRR